MYSGPVCGPLLIPQLYLGFTKTYPQFGLLSDPFQVHDVSCYPGSVGSACYFLTVLLLHWTWTWTWFFQKKNQVHDMQNIYIYAPEREQIGSAGGKKMPYWNILIRDFQCCVLTWIFFVRLNMKIKTLLAAQQLGLAGLTCLWFHSIHPRWSMTSSDESRTYATNPNLNPKVFRIVGKKLL